MRGASSDRAGAAGSKGAPPRERKVEKKLPYANSAEAAAFARADEWGALYLATALNGTPFSWCRAPDRADKRQRHKLAAYA